GGRDRALARAAFANALPSQVFHRRSKGSFTGYSGEVYKVKLPEIRRFLLDGTLADKGMLDTGSLRRLLDGARPPGDKVIMRVFDLCMIENWTRQHDGSGAGVKHRPRSTWP